MNIYSLAHPPDIYISRKYGQGPPPDLTCSQKKVQSAEQLFAPFLFFDNFPLNLLSHSRGFKGKLSDFFAEFGCVSRKTSHLGKKSRKLCNLADSPYDIRAPPGSDTRSEQMTEPEDNTCTHDISDERTPSADQKKSNGSKCPERSSTALLTPQRDRDGISSTWVMWYWRPASVRRRYIGQRKITATI